MFPTALLRDALTAKAHRTPQTVKMGRPRTEDDGYWTWDSAPTTIPMGMDAFCKSRGINSRYLYKESLGEYIVDAICCAAGIHPSEVYEDWHSLADSVEVA